MSDKKWLSALKPLASKPTQWAAFEEMLDFYMQMHQKSLEHGSDPIDVYRAQGSVMALKKLKQLKDEIYATT